MKIGKINIYDYIGEGGITAGDILNLIQQLEDSGCEKFEVRINSKGGEIFDGFSIYNTLKERDVDIYIDGIAASIASVIAMAGKNIYIYKNSYLMIHNPWTFAIGDNNDLFKTAEELEKFRNTIINMYLDKTGKTEDELKTLMNETTYFTAETAEKHKFVDKILEHTEPKNYVALYSEIYDNNPNNSEEVMNKKFLAFMGFTPKEIEDGVSDEAYNAKLTELGLDESSTLDAILKKVKAPEKNEDSLEAKVVAQAKELKELKDSIAATEKVKAEANKKEKAETLVNSAISNFKILASQKETYITAALANFDKVKAELEAIKKDSVKGKIKVGDTFDETNPVQIGNAIKKYVAEQAQNGNIVSDAEAARIVMG